VGILRQNYRGPKSAGSALVIGKIVLTMLVAAAKINQSSIVPAFDQTRVRLQGREGLFLLRFPIEHFSAFIHHQPYEAPSQYNQSVYHH